MPNYMDFLDANPDLKATSTNFIDGENKFIQLRIYNYQVAEQWGGYMYRRDWIIQYGKNPKDGTAFNGEYTLKNEDGSINTDSRNDNVVFPSGGSDPVTISDWEWMLDIFKTAITKQGIDDGYCMSLYYPGFNETGTLVSSFVGGSASWYKDKENKIQYGLTGDDFKLYLQTMNQWYKNGWIDKAFPEHATDSFYTIDDAKVRQGKVGLWYGLKSQLIVFRADNTNPGKTCKYNELHDCR